MRRQAASGAFPGVDARGATGDALDRLREERRQIEELFEAYAAHRREGDWRAGEAARLASLIFTLLRVHDVLEHALLQPTLQRHLGAHPSLHKAASRRQAVMEAVEQLETLATTDPTHPAEMATLGLLARAWFEVDETEVFELARHSPVDLAALDLDMAARQEQLLTAGRER